MSQQRYCVLPDKYEAYIARKRDEAKEDNDFRAYYDLISELEATADWRWMANKFIIVDFTDSGLTVFKSIGPSPIIKTLPIEVTAPLIEPAPAPAPNYCPIINPFPIGAEVDYMGVPMKVIDRQPQSIRQHDWEYKLEPIRKHSTYMRFDWYPHSLLDFL